MQPVSQLFPFRQGLKILPRHGADGQRQHHVYNGGQQHRRQYRPSLGQKAAEQAIAGPGRQRHHRRQKNGEIYPGRSGTSRAMAARLMTAISA